jgi:flagellar basal body-associated protein FliL
MKKIALIILVLLIFAGLMAGGILPVGQKSKSKNKKKGKK